LLAKRKNDADRLRQEHRGGGKTQTGPVVIDA
jgi:hypothetical protein